MERKLKKKINDSEIADFLDLPRTTFYGWKLYKPKLYLFLEKIFNSNIHKIDFENEQELKLIQNFINLSIDDKEKVLKFLK